MRIKAKPGVSHRIVSTLYVVCEGDFIAKKPDGSARVYFTKQTAKRFAGELGGDARVVSFDPAPPPALEFYCTFCGAHRREVKRMITGINGYICEKCVGVCAQICDYTIDERVD